jgi:hypothetical protein
LPETGVAVYAGDNTVKAFGGEQNGNEYWQEYVLRQLIALL